MTSSLAPIPTALVALLGIGPAQAPAAAQEVGLSPEVRELLDLRDKDLKAFHEGKVVARTPQSEGQDVNLASAVRIAAPFHDVFDALPDVLRAVRGGMTQGAGLPEPGSPPAPGWLSLPEKDFEAFPKCTVGKCDMKLSDALIEELATLDWSDATATANAFMERTLTDLLAQYHEGGDAALMTYHDKEEPQSAGEGIQALIRDSGTLTEWDPAFQAYLLNFPTEDDRVTDLFFWSIDEFGLKPTLTLNHLATATAPDGGPTATVAIKQLYAAHYYQSSTNIIYLGSLDPDDPEADTYVLVVSRGRFDAKLSFIERPMAERGIRDQAHAQLAELKKTLESR